ncbi:restriction endonuclease subunit S [Streptomyces sp. enrichment culture]|uniref:restriction endonuclease subunit S n=1 Tax=Streptomyces sp. enrichment culture TaxID=1795815 RepID=UPI003F57894E
MTRRALKDLVKPVQTLDPKSAFADEFTYIDIASVDQKTKRVTGARPVPREEAPSRARQLVHAGDILVSTVRPNLNAVAPVPIELNGAIASTGFCVLRPGPDLDSDYLKHWVMTSEFVHSMVSQATGQSYPAVSDRIVKQSTLPVPSVERQRRIASVLDQVDVLRAKRRQAIALLEDLIQSIFLDMFGDPFNNPNGFPLRALDTLITHGDRINYGVVQPGTHNDDGVTLIRAGDLHPDGIDRSSLMKISPDIEARYSRSRIKGNEILVGCVGAIGAVTVVDTEDIGSNVARAVARIPITSDVDREFLAAYLRMDFVQQYFERELRTVAQPTLNIKQLKEAPVVLPPENLRAEFVNRARAAAQQRQTHRAHLVSLNELFTSLQQRAFSGTLWDHEAAA